MSSFVRNIQRTVKRAQPGHPCRAPNYLGRGSKLGVSNKPSKRKGPPRGSRRGTHKRPQRAANAA